MPESTALSGTANASANPLIIDQVAVETIRPGMHKLRANVDGDDVWFTFSGVENVERRVEPFIGAALLPAIAHGRVLVIKDGLLSPKLLKSLEAIQRVITLWSPETRQIPIEPGELSEPMGRPMVTCTFSGGVDSMSTLIRHRDEITHLMFINGFDMRDDDSWDSAEAHMMESAKKLGKKAISINSNAHEFLSARGITMPYAHGGLLCSIIGAIAPTRAYVASTYTVRELKPWGSHPVLDPLWATATTEIIHDACELRRSEKTALIASHPEALELLQVCWNRRVGNCGNCTKCRRTQLTLSLLGVDRGPFPAIDPTECLSKVTPGTTQDASYTWDLWKLADDRGHDQLASALKKILTRFRRKRAARNFLKSVIGDSATRSLHKVGKKQWLTNALPLQDPDDLR